MIDIIYLTYKINNLKFSLQALKDLNYEFNLIIHNDNPDVKLTKEWLEENCDLNEIKYNNLTILNEEENVGMLFSRINSFNSIENSEYTIFMDDDDYLLITDLPEFNNNYCWYRYNIAGVDDITKLNSQEFTYKPRIHFGITGSFWKSHLLKETFEWLENNKFECKINMLEDFTIQQISDAISIKKHYNYLKHSSELGMIYTVYNTQEKYNHIKDPRYCKEHSDYVERLHKYITDLRLKILNSELGEWSKLRLC